MTTKRVGGQHSPLNSYDKKNIEFGGTRRRVMKPADRSTRLIAKSVAPRFAQEFRIRRIPALLQGSVIETPVEITRGEVRSPQSSKIPATSPRGIGKTPMPLPS
jgi:hypothetical protein